MIILLISIFGPIKEIMSYFLQFCITHESFHTFCLNEYLLKKSLIISTHNNKLGGVYFRISMQGN